jgi:hypothetical protein
MKQSQNQISTFSALWLGFFLGCVCGLLLAFAIYIRSEPVTSNPSSHFSLSALPDELTESNSFIDHTVSFQFYRLLSQAEYVKHLAYSASTQSKNKHKKNPSITKKVNPNKTKPINKKNYFLQLGAFKQVKSAEKLKKQLITKHHLIIQIQKYKNHQGKIHYRVRSGPYDSKVRAQNIRQRLAKNHIQAILLTVER